MQFNVNECREDIGSLQSGVDNGSQSDNSTEVDNSIEVQNHNSNSNQGAGGVEQNSTVWKLIIDGN